MWTKGCFLLEDKMVLTRQLQLSDVRVDLHRPCRAATVLYVNIGR